MKNRFITRFENTPYIGKEIRAPEANNSVSRLYSEWIKSDAKALLHTSYHQRENTTKAKSNPINLNW